MNPYQHYVLQYARLAQDAKSLPLGRLEPLPSPKLSDNAPRALFFAPHPDDECIIGGLALRLLREAGMRVSNVAVTLGSNKARRHERLKELQNACRFIGFELLLTAPEGLENVNIATRERDSATWTHSVNSIRLLLEQQRPRVIFFPHAQDWNSTHIGTHFLIMDALKELGPAFECYLVETEFWGQMNNPNLMIEISPDTLADMVAATTFHVGEVKRNPYHLLMPAWMQDNVRRGAELVGGQGGAAPDFTFAVLYRLTRWKDRGSSPTWKGGKQVSRHADLRDLFS